MSVGFIRRLIVPGFPVRRLLDYEFSCIYSTDCIVAAGMSSGVVSLLSADNDKGAVVNAYLKH